MDPLSALGVAAAVVQFVDFTSSLIQGTYKIYTFKTGDRNPHSDLETISSSLNNVTKKLASSLAATDTNNDNEEIIRMCRECSAIAQDLHRALKRLGSEKENTIWSSFQQALKTIWKQSQIDGLQKRMGDYRAQISMLVLVSLRHEVSSLHNQNRSDDVGGKLKETRDLSEKILTQVYKSNRWQQEVIQAINQSHDSGHALGDVKGYLGTKEYERFKEELLIRLRFIEMTTRVFAIQDAYDHTYEWIFDEDGGSHDSWSNFAEWLRSDSPMYWITGKPGADMQMSQEGLIRTLLYQALKEMPELIPLAFPNRLEMFLLFDSRFTWLDSWEFPELAGAFQAIVREASKTRKLAIFIDGLDEYHGHHTALIKFVQGFLLPNVKICVSSRPWNVFQDAFMHKPSLRLEDLTYHDIHHFVTSHFAANPGFSTLEELDPEYAKELIKSVTKKASGVFLWEQLVTQSLLEGLSNGERLSDLQRRVDALPADLERLFEKIVDSLDKFHLERASQLLQIIRVILAQPDLLTLSYADEEDPELAFTMAVAPLDDQQKEARAKMMQRRINACFKGLLEVSKRRPTHKGTVSYLHRTVRDFIERDDVWNKLLSSTKDSHFNPVLRLATAHLVSVKTLDADEHTPQLWSHVFYVIEYTVRADPQCGEAQKRYLKELDRACAEFSTTRDVLGECLLDRFKAESWIHSAPYWTMTRRGTGLLKSFMHLAVYGQLVNYVKKTLPDDLVHMDEKRREETLFELLHIATDRTNSFEDVPSYDGKMMTLKHKGPNLELVKFLRNLGGHGQAELDDVVDEQMKNEGSTLTSAMMQKRRSRWREMFKR